MPLLLLGRLVNLTSLQVSPPSWLVVVAMRPFLVRHRALMEPSGRGSRVGWMHMISWGRALRLPWSIVVRALAPLMGPVLCHSPVFRSRISKWMRQPSFSVLDGHSRRSPSSRGLFLVGPRNPSGRGSRALHVLPPSRDLVSHPVQSATQEPILKKSHNSPLGMGCSTGL